MRAQDSIPYNAKVHEKQLLELLEQVAAGRMAPGQAVERLRGLPFEDVGFAKIDHHRALRHGMAEVIFGRGKTPEQIAGIAAAIAARSPNLLITRASNEAWEAVKEQLPEAEYHPISGVITLQRDAVVTGKGRVLVVSAGTSDMFVAQEAALTARLMGSEVGELYDVGVAGLHRLLSHMEELRTARVLVVVAGMEGALPSVIGGLVATPVIAVPTSVGYGASFGGLAALLGMLNSCSSNITVVNIDNGFGAGYVAALINRL